MWSLYSSRGQKWNSQKIIAFKTDLAKVGIDQKSIAGRVWMHEANANFRENKPKVAMAVITNRIKSEKVGKGEAKFLCDFVRSKTKDKTSLEEAEKWCKLGGN